MKAPARLVRMREIQQRLGGISRSTVYDKLNPRSPRFDSTFPKLVKIGARSVGVLEDQLDEWIRSRL